jgi:hypothetical protein
MSSRIRIAAKLLAVSVLLAWQDTVPSHEAAVRELFRVMDLSTMTTQAFDAGIDAQVKANPAIAPYKDVMLEWGHKYFRWEAIEPQLVTLYMETFTEEEVQGLLTFYRTPVGRKSVQALPELFRKGAEIGAVVAQEHVGELQEMMSKRMEEEAGGDK